MLKNAKLIQLEETRVFVKTGAAESLEPAPCTLAEKIEEFVLKLGYSNAQALSVIALLLTRGKVRVDFHDYSQRLQLVSQSDIMPRVDAVAVFDSYLEEMQKRDEAAPSLEMTQKIMIQAPRNRAG